MNSLALALLEWLKSAGTVRPFAEPDLSNIGRNWAATWRGLKRAKNVVFK
jgi:hypothetical protein